MEDLERYGKYWKRAETHFLTEFVIDVAVAVAIYFFTENLFYVFLFVGYCFIGLRQLNTKNRQFEIMNKLDKIEEKLNEMNKDKDIV